MDAANMLKPALVRGDFRVIGATTSEEYERWICGDPALERRFQRVLVNELSAEQTAEILKARRLRLERHHNVVISDEAIRAAIAITDEHQTDRRRPDRAIDALDEACAHLQAVVQYTVDTERLIVRRRELLRQSARHGEAPRRPKQDEGPDEVEAFARDGMAALERLGAEIEAIFVGGPAPQSTRPQRAVEQSPPPAVAVPPSLADELASLDASLRDHLLTQGVVVRGADIARVVAVATGHQVTWIESLQPV